MRTHSKALGREVDFETHEDGSATVEGVLYSKRDLAIMKRKTNEQRFQNHSFRLMKLHGYDPETIPPDQAHIYAKPE